MHSIRKRIYASSVLLFFVLLFNAYCYVTINKNLRQKEQANYVTGMLQGLQSHSKELSQSIIVMTALHECTQEKYKQQSDEIIRLCDSVSRVRKALENSLHTKQLSSYGTILTLRSLLPELNLLQDKLVSLAKIPLKDTSAHKQSLHRQHFISEVQSCESALKKNLSTAIQFSTQLTTQLEKQIGVVHRMIITSLVFTLISLVAILTIPTIRLNVQSYRQLQQTVEEANKSETILRTAIDASPNLIFIVDKHQKYKMVNKKLANTLNIAQESLIGKDDLELGLSPEVVLGNASKGIRNLWADNKEVIETGVAKIIPEVPLELNGVKKVLSMTKVPIRDHKGNIWGVLAFALDITERVEAQNALQESEKKYRSLFQGNPMPMWIFDPVTLRFLEVNQMAVQHYGYSRDEFYSMTIADIRPDCEKQRLHELLAQTKTSYNRTNLRGEWEHIKRNGEKIFVDIISHKIMYNGEAAMLILANDITKQKELQHQLIEEKITYQKEIAKATINTQEKERNEIGKELHDNVNQILSSAKLYIEYMIRQNSTEHLPMTMEIVDSAIQEIRKISKTFVPPFISRTGLIPAIQNLLQNIETTLPLQTFLYHDGFSEDSIDEGLKLTIYRIIQEQTTNIVKYANCSEIKVELSQLHQSLNLKISDNGRGFSLGEHSEGIGLKNIKNRAEIYQGKLEILTSPGKGCNVHVDFKIDGKTAADSCLLYEL